MTPSTAALVDRFARTFNATYADRHTVTSPLGFWLLLAVVAPAATGADRDALAAVLGTDPDDAAARAAQLLAEPHPAVSSAAAVWGNPRLLTEAFEVWAATLPPSVASGPIPAQPDADAWCAAATQGLIPRFPVELDAETASVVATALASRVRWAVPFEEADPASLGGSFGRTVSTALVTPDHGHDVFLADTAAAGRVAVHRAMAADGLDVLSVIAAPDVAPAAVHSAAGEVAGMLAGWSDAAVRVSAFDVPEGAGHAWTVTETVRESTAPGRGESARAVLPAWRASGDHDLTRAAGAAEVVRLLARFERAPGAGGSDVRQVAVASYTAEGFEAAALTYAVRAAGIPEWTPVPWRELDVRFDRPYAVVAVARRDALVEPSPEALAERPWEGARSTEVAGAAWAGVPVFSAWVSDPD